MDAAQVFDRESGASDEPDQRARLKIAIVGFGNFGQYLARTFAAQGHAVIGHSRSDHSAAARSLGAAFFRDPHDLCEQHPDVVVLCTSILSTEAVLRSLPLQRLRRSTLFVDVLSVKEFPRNLLLQLLPPEFDILCTHPMFGPESGKHGWSGLPFVYDNVRIGDSEDRANRCRRFLDIFAREGCRMVEMSCTEHDENAAEIQFLTHTVGRLLAKLDLKPTPINTKGYKTPAATASTSTTASSCTTTTPRSSSSASSSHSTPSGRSSSVACMSTCASSSSRAPTAAVHLAPRKTEDLPSCPLLLVEYVPVITS
ncbi:Arogenate dehydrogenase [Musa troglodytarum]|uniref:Arogenate dehydrogenase n=1 Tax=Musa troglodytarum TaxID=320322 RepID=A0A9E7FXW4_9LILI|nr:Arogenate dehydrogenase [Musa troglodytarum]